MTRRVGRPDPIPMTADHHLRIVSRSRVPRREKIVSSPEGRIWLGGLIDLSFAVKTFASWRISYWPADTSMNRELEEGKLDAIVLRQNFLHNELIDKRLQAIRA